MARTYPPIKFRIIGHKIPARLPTPVYNRWGKFGSDETRESGDVCESPEQVSRYTGTQDTGRHRAIWSVEYHATLTGIRTMSTLELESLIFLGILFVFHQNIKNFQIRINVRELIHRALLFTGMIRM